MFANWERIKVGRTLKSIKVDHNKKNLKIKIYTHS